jgi:pyrimidine deaminase RibD-like protein
LHASDLLLLKAATELAEQGRFTCAPNPTVGCIIVRQGELIGRGYHAVRGEGHAEVQAIKDAGGDVSGATVYVSLEPCAFEGRTPACAQTLIEAKVARVVIALTDPHPRVAGLGAKMLVGAGIEVEQLKLPVVLMAQWRWPMARASGSPDHKPEQMFSVCVLVVTPSLLGSVR